MNSPLNVRKRIHTNTTANQSYNDPCLKLEHLISPSNRSLHLLFHSLELRIYFEVNNLF